MSNRLKIGILGTRGIPNHYGGFEQWAEHLSKGLVEKGCEVFVYNSHNHPYKKSKWKGVNIIHQYDPEYKMGTFGQFIYDLNCILDSRKRHFDVIIQLGFTSSSIWGWLLPKKKTVIVTNMDGIEWSREKFSKLAQLFLKFAEKWAVGSSNLLIADSPVIKTYYEKNYHKQVIYISYGTTLFENENFSVIESFNITPYNYHLVISRLEPENNIETIIKGVLNSNQRKPLLIVGKHNTTHGKYLFQKYSSNSQVQFLGGIFDKEVINNLRYFSDFYFHGHSVGGTNPSLLEAMASGARIVAHDNPYNRSVLNNKGDYFLTSNDITQLLNHAINKSECTGYLAENRQRIKDYFLLDTVINQYFKLVKDIEYRKQKNLQK